MASRACTGWVKEDDELGLGDEPVKGTPVGFGVVAFAEAGDGDALGFWEQANNAPGVELVAVSLALGCEVSWYHRGILPR